ncbi:unnamed protein product [Nyctereutes procyonoides]|uniref:(raccoon dog) hypothetical protein n=1 Tax=Nyctereutes procyonoides TaxID=34880 RepID=A0A811ZY75_NYCPR|nr:unnamed protein product [Nyctereutes procyonoides]
MLQVADGSSFLAADGRRHAAYAVVTPETVVETVPLPIGTTSQKAERIALTRALHLSKGQRVTIYTDSKYAYLIAHTHSILWQERGFLTTKGMPIVNGPLIAKLLEALSLPTEVAIVHCRGHQTSKDMVSIGNNKADSVARKTALSNPVSPILFLNTPHRPSYSIKETQALQALGGKAEGKGWIYIRGKIALPENLAHTLITDIHQSLHIGPRALNQFLQPLFYYPSLPKVIEAVHRACKTCSAVNAQGGIRRPGPNHQLRGHQPGEDWQLDFTHMPRHKAFRYLLTLVDTFTGWIEAYPTARETADVVATILIEHIIPRFGLPRTLQSDNGPAFISSVTQQVAESLNITWKLHIPYHPQSSGKTGTPARTHPGICQPTFTSPILSPAHIRLPLQRRPTVSRKQPEQSRRPRHHYIKQKVGMLGPGGKRNSSRWRIPQMAEVPVTTSTWDANGPMTC